MSSRVNYSGLIIAAIGFFGTRFTVTLAIFNDPVRFYLVGVIPLILGLGLAAFGVALTVAAIDKHVVRHAATWCLVGTTTMLILATLTLIGTSPGRTIEFATVRSQTYFSTFLIGGSVGGTLTGLYAARNKRHQAELEQQTHRLEILNRILRHEVLNSLAVIRGYGTNGVFQGSQTEAKIAEHSSAIEQTLEEVEYLTRHTGIDSGSHSPLNLHECIRTGVSTIRSKYPDASIAIDEPETPLQVRADERLAQVLEYLLENAIQHSPADATVRVTVSATPHTVQLSVIDTGPGLPASQQKLLETGAIQKYDDPETGFGLNITRLLVEGYGGDITTSVDDSGSTITVILPRYAPSNFGVEPDTVSLAGMRPASPQLVVILAAAVFAGIPYGLLANYLGGSVAAIGVFYGIENTLVGWLTHEFHSIVFGFVYAGLIAVFTAARKPNMTRFVLIGLGWAGVLWVVAAGFIAPIWLQLLGISAPIPNFSRVLLVSHIAWGVSLAILTALGYTYVSPWLQEVTDSHREVTEYPASEPRSR